MMDYKPDRVFLNELKRIYLRLKYRFNFFRRIDEGGYVHNGINYGDFANGKGKFYILTLPVFPYYDTRFHERNYDGYSKGIKILTLWFKLYYFNEKWIFKFEQRSISTRYIRAI